MWEGLEGWSPDARGWSMGCGRSRHGSPTLQPDGLHKDRADSREGGKRGGKKQKLSEKNAVKTASGWRERECVCVCVCV